MKVGAAAFIIGVVIGVAYGVLFSHIYPAVEINAGIVALCALFGIGTGIVIVALFKRVFG